jgi:hypothetical protein
MGAADRPSIPKPPGPTIDQSYEWQWAGENWYGRLHLSPDGAQGAVNMLRVFALHKVYKGPRDYEFAFAQSPVINLISGKFEVLGSGALRLSVAVNKTNHDSTAYVPHQITGDLSPTMCFAGKVRYVNMETKEQPEGDMVLVSYESAPATWKRELFDPHRSFEMTAAAARRARIENAASNFGVQRPRGPSPARR